MATKGQRTREKKDPEQQATLSSSARVYGERYAAREELGRGGMGRVLRAHDMKLGRDVALKLLAPGAQKQQRLRFEQEARAAGALNHPNIVDVHDVGEQDGEPFIVTELLEGQTLRTLLSRGPLAPAHALELATQLAEGLAAAHGAGIVHRDIKPENLFLTRQGRLKILDFGIAKLREGPAAPSVRTDTGMMMGTPGYMSPEQVQGEHATARSDVFAFGAVLHEMLSGKGPFERSSAVDSAHAILHDPPAPLPPSPLARLVAHCLQKDPAARPADAGEVLAELRKISPPAPRRPRAAWLTAAALALLAAAAIVALRPRSKLEAVPPSVAVLPFTDLSPNKDQEYFSDGIAEEILNALAHVEGLRVVGRTSSFSFRGKSVKIGDVGRELNVATVLEGSVRKAGDQLRITAQLISTADGYHIWSEAYDRKLADVFAVQDGIARAVVAALKVKLLSHQEAAIAEPRTANPDAYTQYLRGRQLVSHMNADTLLAAQEAFESSLKLDPGFVPARVGLAYALMWRHNFIYGMARAEEMKRRSLEFAEQAIAQAPDLAEGYSVRGMIRLSFLWDWSGAQADLERALALAPGDAGIFDHYAHLLAGLGQVPRAIEVMRKGAQLEPLSADMWKDLGWLHNASGELASAREELKRAVGIAPDHVYAARELAFTELLDGRAQLALAAFERSPVRYIRFTGVALAQHDLGREKEAQQALAALIECCGAVSAYQIGEVYAWSGDGDRAFEWLERSYVQHDAGMPYVKFDPFLRKLRGDPRYFALLKKMNLPVD